MNKWIGVGFLVIVMVASVIGQSLIARKNVSILNTEKGTVVVHATKKKLFQFKVFHHRLKTSFTSVANLVTEIGGMKHYSSNPGPIWSEGDVVTVFAQYEDVRGRKRWLELGKGKLGKRVK